RALDPRVELPVVLAGSVLTGAGPIHDEVTEALRAAGRSLSTAPPGLPGALLLAREAAAELLP
ncbi:MAG: N-acetylglucosamine kinase, partial [Brachybacterium sp.]|nr:N-acetylglucosamine kinase [Brachybacterium sp.]